MSQLSWFDFKDRDFKIYKKGQQMMQKEMNALRIVETTRASNVEGVIDIDSDEEEVEMNQVKQDDIFKPEAKAKVEVSGDTSDGKNQESKTDEKVQGEVNVVDSVWS